MRSVFVRAWVLTWRERFSLIGLGFLTLLPPPAVFAVPQGVPQRTLQGALKGPNDREQSPPPSGMSYVVWGKDNRHKYSRHEFPAAECFSVICTSSVKMRC